jgi:hypothetical protein
MSLAPTIAPADDDASPTDLGWGGDDEARTSWYARREALRPILATLAALLLVGSALGLAATVGMAMVAAVLAQHPPAPPEPVEQHASAP